MACVTHPAEIDPGSFEDELRSGADVVVIDVRDAAAFGAWHIPDSGTSVLNVPEADVASYAEETAVPAGTAVRVICNAGNASLRVRAMLEHLAGDVRSVHDGMIGWSRVLQAGDVPLAGPVAVVQFRREARGCLSYLVTGDGEALVVDPAPDVQPYLAAAAARGARIRRVLDTHVHADHVSGARELAHRAGATLHLSHQALVRGVRYASDVAGVGDADALTLGREAVHVVALPGHTTDMIGVRIGDEALIGGDSLFLDSVARPDLEAGDEGSAMAARQLYRTLRERVLTLPVMMLLLPCHYAGGRLSAPLVRPLGDVREAVPELDLDEDSFVRQVLGAMPPRPANYLAIIAVNLGDDVEPEAAARLEVGANNCAVKRSPVA
jgi:glyoxylase-like metal-dependent hydrolase (beta-lactamase superfamily II)/rhodanese-related sulfurtransferase